MILCESAGALLSVTRGGVGVWSLETGALEARVAERPHGGW